MKQTVESILDDTLRRHRVLEGLRGDIAAAYEALCAAYERGGKLLVCGNGGSAADADHIVGELMKGFLLKRPLSPEQAAPFTRAAGDDGTFARGLQGALPAIALHAHGALYTAYCNDVAADMAFAQQVYGYGRAGDALVAMSTSGNSRNIINALYAARGLGMATVGITGIGGGAMTGLCDVCLRMPSTQTYEIQEATLPVYHALCAMLEARFFAQEEEA